MDYGNDIRYVVLRRLLYFILIASILSIVSNIYNRRSLEILMIPIVALILNLIIFFVVRVKPYVGKITALCIFNLLILPTIWIFSPGIASASSSYAMMIIVLSILFVEKRWEFGFPIVSIILSLILIQYEYINPEFYEPYPSRLVQVNDVTMNFAIVIIMGSIFIAYFNRFYQLHKDKIYQISITDELTGIYNRRYFYSYGEKAFQQFKRYKRKFSLAMIDIDYLKDVNDKYGHGYGDQVLTAVVGTVNGHLRLSDVFGRIGGDEFGLILNEISEHETREVLERIRRSIEKLIISTPDGPMAITCSLGAHVITASDQSFEAILRVCDDRLYDAKELGRNKVVM